MDNKQKGALGELLAERYLIRLGYKVLHRNWTCHWGEVDLIALDGGTLVFVEVKYRSSTKFGHGSTAITRKKLISLHRTAKFFLSRHQKYKKYRMDAVEAAVKAKRVILRHHKDCDGI